MSNIYTIAAGHRTLRHVEADTKAEARRVALSDITVTKLSASEAVDLTRRGIAIVSAKTGKVCNASDEDMAADAPADVAAPQPQSLAQVQPGYGHAA